VEKLLQCNVTNKIIKVTHSDPRSYDAPVWQCSALKYCNTIHLSSSVSSRVRSSSWLLVGKHSCISE
jgi:hypothetical protein